MGHRNYSRFVDIRLYHTSSMEGNILHFVLTALRLLAFIKHDRKT